MSHIFSWFDDNTILFRHICYKVLIKIWQVFIKPLSINQQIKEYQTPQYDSYLHGKPYKQMKISFLVSEVVAEFVCFPMFYSLYLCQLKKALPSCNRVSSIGHIQSFLFHYMWCNNKNFFKLWSTDLEYLLVYEICKYINYQ